MSVNTAGICLGEITPSGIFSPPQDMQKINTIDTITARCILYAAQFVPIVVNNIRLINRFPFGGYLLVL